VIANWNSIQGGERFSPRSRFEERLRGIALRDRPCSSNSARKLNSGDTPAGQRDRLHRRKFAFPRGSLVLLATSPLLIGFQISTCHFPMTVSAAQDQYFHSRRLPSFVVNRRGDLEDLIASMSALTVSSCALFTFIAAMPAAKTI